MIYNYKETSLKSITNSLLNLNFLGRFNQPYKVSIDEKGFNFLVKKTAENFKNDKVFSQKDYIKTIKQNGWITILGLRVTCNSNLKKNQIEFFYSEFTEQEIQIFGRNEIIENFIKRKIK